MKILSLDEAKNKVKKTNLIRYLIWTGEYEIQIPHRT
jgi:hypothetical protein